jgi:hypothetical protein
MTKLTKQGVRDLNDPKQQHHRTSKQEDGCIHDWKHDPMCPCDAMGYDDYLPGPCWEVCRKCGKTRRV